MEKDKDEKQPDRRNSESELELVIKTHLEHPRIVQECLDKLSAFIRTHIEAMLNTSMAIATRDQSHVFLVPFQNWDAVTRRPAKKGIVLKLEDRLDKETNNNTLELQFPICLETFIQALPFQEDRFFFNSKTTKRILKHRTWCGCIRRMAAWYDDLESDEWTELVPLEKRHVVSHYELILPEMQAMKFFILRYKMPDDAEYPEQRTWLMLERDINTTTTHNLSFQVGLELKMRRNDTLF